MAARRADLDRAVAAPSEEAGLGGVQSHGGDLGVAMALSELFNLVTCIHEPAGNGRAGITAYDLRENEQGFCFYTILTGI